MLSDLELSQLATRLTGKKWVAVETRRAPWKGYNGVALANPGGEFTIYVDPSLDGPNQYHVFLHEAAHVKLHGDNMTPTTNEALHAKPEDHRPDTGLKTAWLDLIERQAEDLANKWDIQAKNAVGEYSNYEQRLKALYAGG